MTAPRGLRPSPAAEGLLRVGADLRLSKRLTSSLGNSFYSGLILNDIAGRLEPQGAISRPRSCAALRKTSGQGAKAMRSDLTRRLDRALQFQAIQPSHVPEGLPSPPLAMSGAVPRRGADCSMRWRVASRAPSSRSCATTARAAVPRKLRSPYAFASSGPVAEISLRISDVSV